MSRRLLMVGFVVAALVAGGLLDRRRPHSAPAVQVRHGPHAASARAVTSSWYCTGGTAAAGGVADTTILVTNAGRDGLRGTVTVVPSQGEQRLVDIEVPAAGRTAVRAQDWVSAPYVSALVELNGGQVVAEVAASGPLGASYSPCASAASDRWYFAEGATTRDATEVLALFNPFPEDAIVDMSFGTEEGRAAPEALSGVVVKGRQMLAVNIGEHVHRRQVIAASVIARIGRIVTGRLQSFDGSAGRKGVTLALGAPTAGRQWYFPEGLAGDGLTERYQIFNPFRSEAVVDVELALERGEAEPLQLRVPGASRLTVSANEENRIPKGVPHAAVVRLIAGQGVIVERTTDATTPSARSGVAWTLGASSAARRWAFAAGGDDGADEWVTVFNPGTAGTTVSVAVLTDGQNVPVEGLQSVPVGRGERISWRLADHVRRAGSPVVVTATSAVVVERGTAATKGVGTSMAMAIPL